jgi:serine/threonine-protein kinase
MSSLVRSRGPARARAYPHVIRAIGLGKELEPGEEFGPYRIAALLGEGGMGRVYDATGPAKARVALKLMRPNLAADDAFRRRFERESELADKVDHPHVVPVLDRGEIDGVLYIAQRFVDGRSLGDELSRHGTLPLEALVRLAAEVGGALEALHGCDLIHRDVKPDNIMLDSQGAAYVTDLGLAKDRAATTVLTRFGEAIGTRDYMAPEQIRGGAAKVDARADVYGLGCVLFECIAGKPPFAGQHGMRLLWAHLHDDPPDPCADRDDVPAEVGWAVRKALAKEPEERLPSTTALARLVQVGSQVAPTEAS